MLVKVCASVVEVCVCRELRFMMISAVRVGVTLVVVVVLSVSASFRVGRLGLSFSGGRIVQFLILVVDSWCGTLDCMN